jgi:hypothetical protein
MRQVEGRLIVFRAFRGLTVERNTEALRNKSKLSGTPSKDPSYVPQAATRFHFEGVDRGFV